LRRALDLSPRDQLRILEALSAHLVSEFGFEIKRDREIQARVAALDALAAAAAHLDLAPGAAPKLPEYRQAARETALPLSHQQVIRAWGRWETAVQVYEGERPPLSPAQLATRRTMLGARRAHEDMLDGVRQWLATSPASTALADYRTWARAENDRRDESEPRLVENADYLRLRLGVAWLDVIAAARGEVDIEQRAAERLRSLLDEAGPLIGIGVVARLLGTVPSVIVKYASRSTFPRSVATVEGDRVWLRSDIEAYRDGRRFPRRTENEWQDRLMDSSEIAGRLGISRDRVRSLIYEERWDRIPRPAGKVSRRYYWLREGRGTRRG
jgi:predicted DNA-binding transcriptional regulator AlpA